MYLFSILLAYVQLSGALSVGAQTRGSVVPRVSILDKDRRLTREISLEYSPLQGSGFLKSLWSRSGCEFTTIGGAAEFPIDFFTVLAKNVTVRDMMESYACFYRVKWQKTKLGYALITGNGELEAVFAPTNPFRAARDAASLEFVNATRKIAKRAAKQD